jgi:serine/threonine protein kinase
MEENLHCLRKETRLIGRYTIEGVLGQGGFGITYLGIDELHEKKVAIKEFFPQGIVTRNIEYEDTVTVTFVGEKANYEKGKERFLKEARTMAKFSKDEGIVKALDFFEINNTAYIVMEYLEGITLKRYLRENQRIAPEDLIELLVPLIESLDEIHSQGMIHRDISPDNIMVLPDGRIKLMDFGAARDYTEFGEKSLSIVLKPGYAPPEQYQTHGVQGPWTDIYALCATMYKCITGENPPDAIERVMDDSLKKISEFGIVIPPQEEAAIIKGMSVSAKDRYQDIKDFCEDLYGGYEEDAYSAPQEYILQNPGIQHNAFEKIVTWDCLWFGSYPQTQIREKDGAIYTILKNEKDWDSNNDIVVNGIKYHKKEENYFRYEPIKWRILQRDNTTAFLLSDIILDIQPYHKETEEIFWGESHIRNWLNKNFMEAAFISQEQQMIEAMKRLNVADNAYGMPENYTMDKIFLLSEEEISETSNAQRYGFSKSASSYDKARKSESSQYAKDTSWWWIQAVDMENGVRVGADGWISKNGYYILKYNAGIRSALSLNLSSNLFSYAGTVSSDGTVNEVGYDIECGWILK